MEKHGLLKPPSLENPLATGRAPMSTAKSSSPCRKYVIFFPGRGKGKCVLWSGLTLPVLPRLDWAWQSPGLNFPLCSVVPSSAVGLPDGVKAGTEPLLPVSAPPHLSGFFVLNQRFQRVKVNICPQHFHYMK